VPAKKNSSTFPSKCHPSNSFFLPFFWLPISVPFIHGTTKILKAARARKQRKSLCEYHQIVPHFENVMAHVLDEGMGKMERDGKMEGNLLATKIHTWSSIPYSFNTNSSIPSTGECFKFVWGAYVAFKNVE
jgi:hypothetical protein